MICQFFYQNKATKTSEDEYFILSFYRTSLNKKQTPVCHDNMTQFDKNYVKLEELLSNIMKNRDE